MNKKNGFTLIEIISVVIILGILMILAVPAVTSIIGDSRASTYVTDANSFITSARNIVTNKSIYIGQDMDTTFYIPYSCIKDELEHKSPYGEWNKVYVAITYDGEKYYYYYTSNDEAKKGIYLTYEDLLSEDIIEDNVEEIYTGVTIGSRPKILVIKDDCDINNAEEVEPICNIRDKERLTKEELDKCLKEGPDIVPDDLKVEVTYDSGFTGDGSCEGTKTVIYNKPYGSLCTPTKTGNEFVGWYTERTGGLKIKETTKVTNKEPHTLYAHFGGNEYIVTYENNGGSGCISKKVIYGDEYGELCVPTKAGVNFYGWFQDKELTIPVTSETIVNIDRSHTLYAAYTDIDNLIIRYNTNGGTNCEQMVRHYDEEYGTLCTTTKAGYTFNGWYTGSAEGTLVTSKTRATSSTTLHARWIANDVTIILRENGEKTSTSGYSVSLSTSSTTDTGTRFLFSTNGTVIFEAVPNGTYYIWAGKNSNAKNTRIYSGVSVKVNDNKPSAIINYYSLKLAISNGIIDVSNNWFKTENPI